MKLKINKACDLSSISVLPPHTRRSSIMAPQHSLSQPSQQSFSQGVSSQQNGMFSQISQNSLDDALTGNLRFNSQEKEKSMKRVSCLAPISYSREESQMPISRSSSSLTHRWSSVTVPNNKCQLSDELEHRIIAMETSISRIGMIVDSIQADVMQLNKGTKELTLEVEGIRQKSVVHDDSLHLLNRRQEDIRAGLDVGFKSISDKLSKITQQDKLQEILSAVFNLPERIDTNVQIRDGELLKYLSGDLQEITCSLKTLNQKNMDLDILQPKVTGADHSSKRTLSQKNIPLAILAPKVTDGDHSSQKTFNQRNMALAMIPRKVTGADSSSHKSLPMREAVPTKISKQAPLVPKIEMGSWTTVKAEQVTSANRYGNSCMNLKQRRTSPMDREQKVVIELDDETDEDLSCFIVQKELDNHLMDDVDKETEHILMRARRRKRKQTCKRLMQTH